MVRRSWARRGGSLVAAVALLAGYQLLLLPVLPSGTPEWVSIAVLAVAWVTTGVGLQAFEARRWNRTARALDLEPSGTELAGRFTRRPHTGRRRGRTVGLEFHDVPRSLVGDSTVVWTRHEHAAPLLVVERAGAGGTGGSDLPPRVELDTPEVDAAFDETFRAYCEDPAFAREVLDATVRDAVATADELVDVRVEGGRVTAETSGVVSDEAVLERYFTAVCFVAERAERAIDT